MTINHDPIPTLDVIEAAIRAGDGLTVRTLLPLVPEARDHSDERGQGLLHLAARMGNNSIAEALLEHSFDPEALDAHGKSPADVAAAYGNMGTPLHVVAMHGLAMVVRPLLKAGVNPRARTACGKTARDLAERRGHHAVVKALIGHDE